MVANKSRYIPYILGIVLILMMVIFPLATAEEGDPDGGDSGEESSSEEDTSSESTSEDSSESTEDSESSEETETESTEESEESSSETSEETTSEDFVSSEENIEETGTESTNEVSSDETIEETTETSDEGPDTGAPEGYEDDETAVYYEIGEEEEPEQGENETAEPEYYEIDPEEIFEDTNQTVLKGDVKEVVNNETNISEFYIELEDIIEDDNFDIDFSDIDQGEIFIDEPVNINQNIILTNEDDYEKEITVNLWNYQEKILLGAENVEVFFDGELISEQPIFKLNLESGEEKEVEVLYQYPPVRKEVTFIEETILDLLPSQAKVIDSDIPTDTIISEKYKIKIYHEGPLHYFNINVPIDEVNKEDIKSIYFVEGEAYLLNEEGVVMLPKLNEGED